MEFGLPSHIGTALQPCQDDARWTSSLWRASRKLTAMTVLEVGRLDSEVRSGVSGFQIEIVRDWKQAASHWNCAGHATTFQHSRWLEAWYAAFDPVSPLIAIVSDAASGRQLALVPLIRRVQNGVRIVEFADLGLTDYNAPILAS